MTSRRAFDYIVVGAGSAGCVLASRLCEELSVRVALIEAGANTRNPLYGMTMLAGRLNRWQANNWFYQSEPQSAMNGRTVFLPRGKLVGGSFQFNGAVYVRGNPYDFDSWRQLGNAGWSYADVLPYFRRSEGYEHGQSAFHGEGGPLTVSHAGEVNLLTDVFVQAGIEAGHPHNDDFNGASQDGVGRHDHNIRAGKRWTTAAAFLQEPPANLEIIANAHVTRVVLASGRARGITLARNGAQDELIAEREVIMAAGAVNSPHLLLLSGIGDPEQLRAFGIPVAHALPGVGRNLQDHLCTTLGYVCTQPVSLVDSLRMEKFFFRMAQSYFNGTGPVSMSPLQAGGFIRSRPGLPAPDIQVAFYPILGSSPSATTPRLLWPWEKKNHTFAAIAWQSRPESRGAVSLRSADPFDRPRIDPGYLTAPGDIEVARHGVRELRRIFQQPSFDRYRGEEILPGAAIQSDDQIDDYIRASGLSTYHLCGSCKMGSDAMAVVDHTLRVRGIDALRVADASVMPTMVTGNTNAATIMIAEKASDMIRGRQMPRAEV